MIELRFIKRATHDDGSGIIKVLQQRTKTKWINGSTTANGHFTWDEGQDVPLVKGEEGA